MGTGLPREAEQEGFVATALEGLGRRRIALFLHKPPFVHGMEDPFDYWSVPPAARATLFVVQIGLIAYMAFQLTQPVAAG
jgi:hypothetical protein